MRLIFGMILPIVAAMATRTESCEMSFPTLGNSIFPVGQFHPVLRLLAGDLHEATDPDAEHGGDPLAQQRLGGRPDREAWQLFSRPPALRRNGRALWRSRAGRGGGKRRRVEQNRGCVRAQSGPGSPSRWSVWK